MFLELEREEQQLLIALVAARLHELKQANANGRAVEPHEAHQWELLEHLLHHLHEAEFDVTC